MPTRRPFVSVSQSTPSSPQRVVGADRRRRSVELEGELLGRVHDPDAKFHAGESSGRLRPSGLDCRLRRSRHRGPLYVARSELAAYSTAGIAAVECHASSPVVRRSRNGSVACAPRGTRQRVRRPAARWRPNGRPGAYDVAATVDRGGSRDAVTGDRRRGAGALRRSRGPVDATCTRALTHRSRVRHTAPRSRACHDHDSRGAPVPHRCRGRRRSDLAARHSVIADRGRRCDLRPRERRHRRTIVDLRGATASVDDLRRPTSVAVRAPSRLSRHVPRSRRRPRAIRGAGSPANGRDAAHRAW